MTTTLPAVAEDDELLPVEKQVSFVSAKPDDEFRVHSDVASLTKRLLAHPEFEEERRREIRGDVVAVTGRLPIGCLFVSESPRDGDGWAPIVTRDVLRD